MNAIDTLAPIPVSITVKDDNGNPTGPAEEVQYEDDKKTLQIPINGNTEKIEVLIELPGMTPVGSTTPVSPFVAMPQDVAEIAIEFPAGFDPEDVKIEVNKPGEDEPSTEVVSIFLNI